MALEIKNISKSFKNKIVLKDINMTLEPGRVYGFLGNNGAGKTTLMRTIFNMVIPDTGTITYNGIPQKDINYENWFYFTEKDVVPSALSVKKYLKDIALLAHISLKTFNERMKIVDKYVNTNFKLTKKIKNLSSGQQKVVGCLALLILKPDVIFLDEPTANMDVRNQEFVLDIIKELMGPERIVVITTHLLKEIGDSLTDVVILDKGMITYSAPNDKKKSIEEIFEKYTTPEVKGYEGMSKKQAKKAMKKAHKAFKKAQKKAKKGGDISGLAVEVNDNTVDEKSAVYRANVNEERLEEYIDEE